MKQFVIFVMVLTCLLVIDVFACSTCADMGYLEKSENCGRCKTRGRVPDTRHYGRCSTCNGSGRVGQYRRPCTYCLGTGERHMACPPCEGTGTKKTRTLCPRCKGGSVVNAAAVGTVTGGGEGNTPAANNVAVEACTQCDEKGNVTTTIKCKICDHGWNHKKNAAGVYVCRNCDAECESRFAPCKCEKPDCSQCKGKHEKTETAVCPLCGGDKLVTPLKRERAKKKAEEEKK